MQLGLNENVDSDSYNSDELETESWSCAGSGDDGESSEDQPCTSARCTTSAA